MRKRAFPALVAVLAACGGGHLPRAAVGEHVLLTVGGMVKKGPYQLGRAELAALPRRSFRAVDPETGRESTYEGVNLGGLVLDKVDLQKGADTLVFRTVKKEAIPVPLWVLRQFRPVLADRVDGKPIDPLVLAWPNVDQPGLETDPRARLFWARAVVMADFVDWSRAYGRALAVPPGATNAARLGAEHYQYHCVACHKLNGAGGERGPDLTRAADRIDPTAFARAIRGHDTWPKAVLDRTPAQQAVADIYAYLRAVAVARDAGGTEDLGEPTEKEPGERPPGERPGQGAGGLDDER